MGKKLKEHRKKVANRNEAIKQEKRKREKVQEEFLKKLIEQEKQKGLFNSPVMPLPSFPGFIEGSVPNFPGMINDGPKI
jgi:hypothetical protein